MLIPDIKLKYNSLTFYRTDSKGTPFVKYSTRFDADIPVLK